jgi:hypothetical protein
MTSARHTHDARDWVVTWVVLFKVVLKRVSVPFVVLGMSHMR